MNEKRRFSKLSSEAYEHPWDRKALVALRQIKGVETIARKVIEYKVERVDYINNIASNVRITESQGGKIYSLLREAIEILDVQEPELYVTNDRTINAWTNGATRPYIVLTSGLLEEFEEPEVGCVIAHEVGHIKSGHVLYRYIAQHFALLTNWIGSRSLGLGDIVGLPIQVALLFWSRRSEFTADRAAQLVAQDLDLSLRTEAKLAGAYPEAIRSEIDPRVFAEQVRPFYELDEDDLGPLYKMWIVHEGLTHPWGILRAVELQKWCQTNEYNDIMSGHYSRYDETEWDGNSCPRCRIDVSGDALFCTICGYKLRTICPKCRQIVTATGRYCPGCGQKLGGESC